MAYGSHALWGVLCLDLATRRHIMHALMQAKLFLFRSQLIVLWYGKPIFSKKLLASCFTNAFVAGACPPVAAMTIGQKEAPSMSLTRASYVLRFSVSCFRYTDGRFSEALDAARGLNTRTSKKVRSNLPPQTPLADMSNLAPSCTLVPAGSSRSTCWSCGSVATSWHVSVITLASRSRISLCRIMGKPPVGHDSACSTSNGLLQTHFVGMWSGCRP